MVGELNEMYEYTEKMFMDSANPLKELLRYMKDEDMICYFKKEL